MQWLQDPTQTNVMQNNGTRAKLVGSRKEKRENHKSKINEHETNNKNK
jgi:hypothetical protein